MKKLLGGKKQKILENVEDSVVSKGPKTASVSEAENGFVIDCNYGEKKKVAEDLEGVFKALKEHFE